MAEMLLGGLGIGDNMSPILASVPLILSDSVSMISRRNLCPSYFKSPVSRGIRQDCVS